MNQKKYKVSDEISKHLPTHREAEAILIENQMVERGFIERPFILAHIDGSDMPTLLDGHLRDQLIDKFHAAGIDYPAPAVIVEHSVKSLSDAFNWIEINVLATRQLTDAQRIDYILKQKTLIERLQGRARLNQLSGAKVEADLPKGSVTDQIAKKAKTGATQVKKVMKVKQIDSSLIKSLIDPLPDGTPNPAGRLFPGKDTTRKLLEQGTPLVDLMLADPDKSHTIAIDEAHKIASWATKKKKEAERLDEARNRIPIYSYNENDGYENKIICGDSRKVLADLWERVKEPIIDFTLTSPPYILPDDMVPYDVYRYPGLEEWKAALAEIMRLTYLLTRTGGRFAIQFDATSDRVLGESTKYPVRYFVEQMAYEIGWKMMDEVCWAKQNAVGNRYSVGTGDSPLKPNLNRNHEYLLVFYKDSPRKEWRHDGDPIVNATKEELIFGKISTWNYDFSAGTVADGNRDSFWYVNPADGRINGPCGVPFPLRLAELAIQTWSWPMDLVFDPHGGNFTTCLAAQRLGRKYLGIDLSEEYCRFGQELLRNGRPPNELVDGHESKTEDLPLAESDDDEDVQPT